MPSAAIMEPWEVFIGTMMKRSNVWMRLPMKVELPEVTRRMGWQCTQGYPHRSTKKGSERIKMSMSTQRHGTLYNSKRYHIHFQEVHGGMETRSIDRSFFW